MSKFNQRYKDALNKCLLFKKCYSEVFRLSYHLKGACLPLLDAKLVLL